MSSTNHTTNYNLPQFVGSDKPAWLGDINPALAAIDTAMHTNATTATQGVTDASTAQSRADSAYAKASDADTAAATAQTTANQAISLGNTNAAKIEGLQNKFILSDIAKVQGMNTGSWGNDYDITVAQNSDGSVFKVYGNFYVDNYTGAPISATRPQVAGLNGTYGFATGIYLNTAPDEAYTITPAGNCFIGVRPALQAWADSISVGTDGQIYVFSSNQQTVTLDNNNSWHIFFEPCIYFNSNFGDTPVTPNS